MRRLDQRVEDEPVIRILVEQQVARRAVALLGVGPVFRMGLKLGIGQQVAQRFRDLGPERFALASFGAEAAHCVDEFLDGREKGLVGHGILSIRMGDA